MQLLIENLHKSFDDNHVLRGATAHFQSGRLRLLGRNGAGKRPSSI